VSPRGDRETGPAKHLPLRPVEFLALAVLADEPLHGYGIVRRIEEETDGRVSLRPGDIYRVIYRLERRGLLTDADPPAGDDGDGRRSYYRITELGREVASEEARVMTGVASRLLGIGEETAR